MVMQQVCCQLVGPLGVHAIGMPGSLFVAWPLCLGCARHAYLVFHCLVYSSRLPFMFCAWNASLSNEYMAA